MRRGVSTSVKGAGVIISLLFIFGLAYAGSVASTTKSQTTTTLQTSTISSKVFTNSTEAIEQASQVSANITVSAYHHDHDRPYAVRNLPDDLILNSFNTYLTDALSSSMSAPVYSVSYNYVYGCPSPSCGVLFEIGTSGNAPARTDTALGAAYTPSGGSALFADTAENSAPTTSPTEATCNTGTTDYVNGISGSQVITGSASIQEVGLFLGYGSSPSGATVLLFHDVFPTISASAGDTVTVSYQVDLGNAGMTTNFCHWMAALFTGNIETDGTDTASLKNTAGSSSGYYVWCTTTSTVADVAALSSTSTCGGGSPQGQMAIGSGTTAAAPSQYELVTQVGSYVATSSATYPTSSGVIYWTSTWTVSGSNTITEDGMFVRLSSNDYMIFRQTFSGQAQSSGTPFGETMRLED